MVVHFGRILTRRFAMLAMNGRMSLRPTESQQKGLRGEFLHGANEKFVSSVKKVDGFAWIFGGFIEYEHMSLR
jgi:hypothetical protein